MLYLTMWRLSGGHFRPQSTPFYESLFPAPALASRVPMPTATGTSVHATPRFSVPGASAAAAEHVQHRRPGPLAEEGSRFWLSWGPSVSLCFEILLIMPTVTSSPPIRPLASPIVFHPIPRPHRRRSSSYTAISFVLIHSFDLSFPIPCLDNDASCPTGWT